MVERPSGQERKTEVPHLSVHFKNEESLDWYPLDDGRGATEFADFNVLHGNVPYAEVFETLGVLNIDKWMGVSQEVYESWEPPDFAPWTPDMEPWFKSSTGLDWANKLISHFEAHRADYSEWDGHADDVLGELRRFHRAMELGTANDDLEWNLIGVE